MTDEAIKSMADAGNKLAVGLLIEECASQYGEAKAKELTRAYVNRGPGLSEGNLWTHVQRARVLMQMFPNPAIRKHLLGLTSGEGIIVRRETGENKGKYVLSPHFEKAVEVLGTAPTTEGDTAEKYARQEIGRAHV